MAIQTMTGLFVASTYLVNGTPIVRQTAGWPLPCAIILYPMSGDTLTIEQSRDGGTFWTTLPNGGAVTVPDTGFQLTAGTTAIRVTRSAGTSSASYFTVC